MISEFSPLTPFYHKALDAAGLAHGSRVWKADGGFVPVQDLVEGDLVFGITFRLEDEYIQRSLDDPAKNIVKVWRPQLVARKVRGVTVVEARSWQLTFGNDTKMSEARRLVCGADTLIQLFPLTHNFVESRRLVDLITAVQNPRTPMEYRRALQYDAERSLFEGRPVYGPTPFSNTPRGDHALVIPYECYGGQTGMLLSDARPYHRWLIAQVREVVPLQSRTKLYQLDLQEDLREELAVYGEIPPRCNVIAQTPFAPEQKRRRISLDTLAADVASIKDRKEFEKKWDEWAERYRQQQASAPSAQSKTVDTPMQGMFYESKKPEVQKSLRDRYGVEEWLNGGILINLAPHP